MSTNASADELWTRWQQATELLEGMGGAVSAASQRWSEATDPGEKALRWVEYMAVTREYRVLSSWQQVFYAAYVFSTDGAECAVLDNPRG